MQFSTAIVEKLRERAARYLELSELVSQPELAGKRVGELAREMGLLERTHALARKLDVLVSRRTEAERLLAAGATADAEDRELAEMELDSLDDEERALDKAIREELVRDTDLDRRKVIVEIRAGTGGDEASLFASDLYQMYKRFFEARRWRSEVIEIHPSDVGGVREITIAVEGDDCWKLLRFESGTHRVQRVPATESQGRIHTSAATVAVLPEAEAVEVDIRDEDIEIDTFRSSGPGGQSVNKTSSAVRITHVPTGTVVSCQDEKSQHKNRAKAMRVLRARLFDAERQRLHDERAAARKSQVGTGDRSERIRTYNYPQNRVSDHRLGENYSLEQIASGRFGPILDALAEVDREERIRRL